MKQPIRTIKLSQDQMDRIQADLECDDSETLAQIFADLLAKLALRKSRAWNEIRRIAELDGSKEYCEISFIDNTIVVLPHGDVEGEI
jgi:hypothetical protein